MELRFARYMVNRQPLVSVIVVLILVIIVTRVLQVLFGAVLDSEFIAAVSAGYLATFLMLCALAVTGSSKAAGITVPPRDWGKGWWVVMAVIAIVALTKVLTDRIDFTMLVFDPGHAVDLVLKTTATGLWEEVWFRGVCFTILTRAWGSTRVGLYKAAATQALLFGALHLLNLRESDLTYVIYQVSFATLIGFGFAGLTAYSRSIWPAVILHILINAAGSIDNSFSGPVYNFPELTLEIMLTVVGMFFLFGALPGAWCLKHAPLIGAPSNTRERRSDP